MRFPSPPIVSAAVSGFVIGVFVTLAATGVIARSSRTAAPPPLPPPRAVGNSDVAARIERLVRRALGPVTANKQPRLVSLKVVPVPASTLLSDPAGGLASYRSVFVVFRLNDHPLGKSWRLRAAKADAFAVMKALYSSDLPIFDVRLVGRFPLASASGMHESDAVIAYETHGAAGRIPWKHWGRENEALLWSKLVRKKVDSRFA